MVNEVKASVDICHNLEYILDRIEEYKDKLDKEDIINILRYYYIFNKEIFNNIL
jgi:hypothetical protein